VITVGILTGPFTVGPTKAVPTAAGAGWIKERSFSLVNTPGEIIASAML
jgi:hypothetical protein